MKDNLPLVLADFIVDATALSEEKVVVSGIARRASLFALRASIRRVLFNDAELAKSRQGLRVFIFWKVSEFMPPQRMGSVRKSAVLKKLGTGRISHANEPARGIGICGGMGAVEAAQAMASAPNLCGCGIGQSKLMLEISVVCVTVPGHRIITADSNTMICNGWGKEIVSEVPMAGRGGQNQAFPCLSGQFSARCR